MKNLNKKTNEDIFVNYIAVIISRLYKEFPLPLSRDEFEAIICKKKPGKLNLLFELDSSVKNICALLEPNIREWIDRRTITQFFPKSANEISPQILASQSHYIEEYVTSIMIDLEANPDKQDLLFITRSIESKLNEFSSLFWSAGNDADEYSSEFIKYMPRKEIFYSLIDKIEKLKNKWADFTIQSITLENKVAHATKTFLLDIEFIIFGDNQEVRLSPKGYQFCFSKSPETLLTKEMIGQSDDKFMGLNLGMLKRFAEKVPEHAAAELGTALAQLGIVYLGLK